MPKRRRKKINQCMKCLTSKFINVQTQLSKEMLCQEQGITHLLPRINMWTVRPRDRRQILFCNPYLFSHRQYEGLWERLSCCSDSRTRTVRREAVKRCWTSSPITSWRTPIIKLKRTFKRGSWSWAEDQCTTTKATRHSHKHIWGRIKAKPLNQTWTAE